MDEIAVITHNPKGEWGDVRPTIEHQGYYDWSRKSIGSPKIGQKVLIYISKGVFRIEYIMQISEINDQTIRLDLISKIDEEKANLLQFENLVAHGLKRSTVNYVLNNNQQLYQYVFNILEGQSMINKEKFDLICACLDRAIEENGDKLSLETQSGTNINLVKRENGNYKVVFNTEKETYEAITKENLYKFLFEGWRGNETLGREDGRITLFEAIHQYIQTHCALTIPLEKRSLSRLIPLNQILYGPPGTGKTYNTITKALEIILENQQNDDIKRLLDKKNYTKIERQQLKGEFEKYKQAGQIEFVTFHQSYGYEEFVEGIKAIEPFSEHNPSEQLIYKTMPGIFQQICNEAQKVIYKTDNNIEVASEAPVWKISLGGSGDWHEVKKQCFKNGEIRIGWNQVKSLFDDAEFNKLETKTQNTISSFMEIMTKGDIVLSLLSATEIDGIGIIDGDYERDEERNQDYPHRRKVKWLIKDTKINILPYNQNTRLTQQTVYRLWRIKSAELLSTIPQEEYKEEFNNSEKKYILIIDEINRGNISKIFGELITLIEPSKRIGADEAIKLKLPYSNEEFGVPQNLYIIGTMNTADRSIALMDTALRRRFHFEEMMPDVETLSDKSIEGIDLKKVLTKINQRVEYLYDRDHTIGHAYFIDVKTQEDLDDVMRNKIFPLLQEYFYDDWEKILMVLGDGFVDQREVKPNIFDDETNEYFEDKKFIYSIKESFDYTKLQS
jgi:5-methylcytosine-specific restriction protein B